MNLQDGTTSMQKTLAQQGGPEEVSSEKLAPVGIVTENEQAGSVDSLGDMAVLTRDILTKALKDQREIQSEQLHAQKMESIGQLAAGMAHEINTPLQYIGGNLDFIGQAFEELSQAVAMLMNAFEENSSEQNPLQNRKDKIDFVLARLPGAISQSREGVENVSRIVRAMRGFSHPTEQPVEADINEAIESTLLVSKNEWKYVADIELDLDKALPKLVCLPAELNQGFLNILVNAAHAIEEKLCAGSEGYSGDYSGEKGLISVATAFNSEYILIKIGDTGIGMSEDVLNRIFEQFFTTKKVGKGTGQGLSICHSIFVERHGGKIDVQSELGEGATFTIRLPRANQFVVSR